MKKDILEYHWSPTARADTRFQEKQKAISAKIHPEVFRKMEVEAYASGVKRNSIINKAVNWYIDELDEAREQKCILNGVPDGPDGEVPFISDLLEKNFSADELEKLMFVQKSLGVDTEHLVVRLLRRMLKNYDRNPFTYL